MTKIIGIGDFAVSFSEEDIIKTYALGSCVALVVYCPSLKGLGMAHIALPDSTITGPGSHGYKEAYFADKAVPLLFDKVCGGLSRYRKEYRVSIFGGALSMNKNDIFNVGLKNIVAIEEILVRNNIVFDATNTGGYYSRTVEADVRTGTPIISSCLLNMSNPNRYLCSANQKQII
ncbi:MAG: chemotaxis protein CheD [Sedimentibacter sp.]|uniref:chemotaxis protein CheD n=1 Tax=Sedimentibacter sp. TaxID=1960295 RepID=UPI0031598726